MKRFARSAATARTRSTALLFAFVLAGVLVAPSTPALAEGDSPSFHIIDAPVQAEPGEHVQGEITDLSADGRTAVGFWLYPTREVFRWTPEGGTELLEIGDHCTSGSFPIISPDGSVIAGRCDGVVYELGIGGFWQGFVWRQATGGQNLGDPPIGNYFDGFSRNLVPHAISRKGRHIISTWEAIDVRPLLELPETDIEYDYSGYRGSMVFGRNGRGQTGDAFVGHFREEEILPGAPGTDKPGLALAKVTQVSADGRTFAGCAPIIEPPATWPRNGIPFVFDRVSGLLELPEAECSHSQDKSNLLLSPNGRRLIRTGWPYAELIWSADGEELGRLAAEKSSVDSSWDGSRLVGLGPWLSEVHAPSSRIDLNDYLQNTLGLDLGGAEIYRASAISHDGRTIAGMALIERVGTDSILKPWIAHLPPACSDHLDNDGDGLVDYPADPECHSAADDDESGDSVRARISRIRDVGWGGSRTLIEVLLYGSESDDVRRPRLGPNGAAPLFGLGGLARLVPGELDFDDDGQTDRLIYFDAAAAGVTEQAGSTCVRGRLHRTPIEMCGDIVEADGCGEGFAIALIVPPLVWIGRRRRR